MKSFRVLIIFVFIAIFLFLVFALYKTYVDVSKSNEYLTYVSTSANNLVSEVESINAELNEINYNEADLYVSNLETKRKDFEATINEIEVGYNGYVLPYGAEDIDTEFEAYLEKVKSIYDSFSEIVTIINDAEEKDVFDKQLDEYIDLSAELDENSKNLESSLEFYAQEYNKIDFKRLIYAIKSV